MYCSHRLCYRLTKEKKRFRIQNCPFGTVGATIGYVLGLLVHSKVVVNLVGKYSSLIVYYKEPIKYGENKHNRTRSSVTIQGNITVISYRNDVIWLVLFLHIRDNLGIWCLHAARSTLVTNNMHTLRWLAKRLDLNPIDHLLDLLKRKVHAQLLQLTLRELTHVFHQICAAILQQYNHSHILLSKSTRYLTVDATPGECTKYWNEIKYDLIWVCSFCFKGVHVYP